MFRRLTSIAALLIALTCCFPGPVTGQDPPAAPAQNVQPGGAAPNVSFGQRTYYLEIFLVVALFGGALFAVCKSSNRR